MISSKIDRLPFIARRIIGYYLGPSICAEVAKDGDIKTLKYLHETIGVSFKNTYTDNHNNYWDWQKSRIAYLDGKGYEYIKETHRNSNYWYWKTCSNAAKNGHLECLKYLHENGCPWNDKTCFNAAKNGHIECLKYAHKNGCYLHKSACIKAVEYGHFECLKYAYENGRLPFGGVCHAAAKNGHIKF